MSVNMICTLSEEEELEWRRKHGKDNIYVSGIHCSLCKVHWVNNTRGYNTKDGGTSYQCSKCLGAHDQEYTHFLPKTYWLCSGIGDRMHFESFEFYYKALEHKLKLQKEGHYVYRIIPGYEKSFEYQN